MVRRWVAENGQEAGRAVWHAAALVEHGVGMLDGESGACEFGSSGGGGCRLWHLPWAVYLGTLVVWGVWYARPVPISPSSASSSSTSSSHYANQDEEDEIIWDPQSEMKSLLATISRSDPERLLEAGVIAGGVWKRGTNGLAAVVSKCLSKVRWAVVHDGMMVLRGLVCWRLVGGGGGMA